MRDGIVTIPMGNMRILWITPDYPSTAFPFAGIFQQMTARSLLKNGVDLEVVAPIPYVTPPLKRIHKRYGKIAALPVCCADGSIRITRPRYLTSPREYIWGPAHLAQRISVSRLGLRKPDLIHAHFAYPVGAAATALARNWGVPFVLTLHGDDVTIHPYVSRWHRRRFAKTVLAADFLIAVSDALAQETEQHSGRRPFVLSTGVDIAKFKHLPEKKAQRKRLNLPPDAFVVLFIGNLVPQKGVSDLAEAFSALAMQNSRLVLVGQGPCRPRGDRIVYFGNRPNREIPGILAAADMLALPSHHEGLGQVILEAGAAGLPVVGADTGGIRDLLSEDRGWLFPPKNVAALCGNLRRVLEDPGEAQRRGSRLKALVVERHTLQKNAAELTGIYQNILCRS